MKCTSIHFQDLLTFLSNVILWNDYQDTLTFHIFHKKYCQTNCCPKRPSQNFRYFQELEELVSIQIRSLNSDEWLDSVQLGNPPLCRESDQAL